MNKNLREWLESILFTAIVLAVLFAVFWPFSITGDSMNDSFRSGDRIAISRAMAWTGRISRGDFVVCKLRRGGRDEHVMKRVIGVPGDSVEIKDGEVRVNGEPLNEDYILGTTLGEVSLTVGAGEYFVMGDNREISYDSRRAGPIHPDDMIGKVICRWYPFNKITVYG